MKQILSTVVLILITTVAFSQGPAQMDFTVRVADLPSSYGGKFIIAVWVEDDAGKYVNSLAVYAQTRIYLLENWAGASKNLKGDAVTGATQSAFKTFNLTWDLYDFTGFKVDNGTYKIRMEATAVEGPGKTYAIDVEVGDESYDVTPDGNAYFKDLRVVYSPDNYTSSNSLEKKRGIYFYPNPSRGNFNIFIEHGEIENIKVQLYDLSGKKIRDLYSGSLKVGSNSIPINLDASLNKGMYILYIASESFIWNKTIVIE
jgi:hypothetical protein